MKTLFNITFMLLFGFSAFAAIPTKQKMSSNILTYQGAIQGGVAGQGFSLLNAKKMILKEKSSERIVFDIGNMQGLPLKGLPGYYHVQLQQNPARLIIDFRQIARISIDEDVLKKSFNGSHFIKQSQMIRDPIDNTISVILDLKKQAKVKVIQVQGQKETSKLVLDFIQ